MRDAEFDNEATRCRKPVRHGRWLKVLGIVFGVYLGACLLGAGFSRRPSECAVCREKRVDLSCFGLRWSRQEETECTRWYSSNVEPTHAHFWVRRTHCRWFGIPGLYSGYSCIIGGPITGLSETVQIEIYKHFQDPLEAKQLFIRTAMDYGPWSALMEWVTAGYPGTWHDWWEKHRPSS